MENIKEFYPTPKKLCKKMVEKIQIESKGYKRLNILEPSAGKGDIIDYINECDRYDKLRIDKIDAIENNTDLRAILYSKKITMIWDDFLTFNTYKNYDVIIMNPPFSNGVKHLLKAIEILKYGGQIICLLNANTLVNTYSNERKELENIIEKYNGETWNKYNRRNKEIKENMKNKKLQIKK